MFCASIDTNGFLVVVNPPPSDLTTCQALLFTGQEKSSLDLLLLGGFDSEAALLAFTGGLLLFAVGLGVGAVVAQIRRLNRL